MRPRLKVVHISDIHIDYKYAVDANQECGLPICCRAENGFPDEADKKAGAWGSYHCDLPQQTFESMLAYIRDTIKPDMVVWTGDTVPHNIWANSNEEVAEIVTKTSNLIN